MHLTTLVGKAWSGFSRLKIGTQPCERVTEPLSSIKFQNFRAYFGKLLLLKNSASWSYLIPKQTSI